MKFIGKIYCYAISFIIFIIAVSGTIYFFQKDQPGKNREIDIGKLNLNKRKIIVLAHNNYSFHLQIADTPQSRQKGLMFVRELPADTGMLFVFPEQDFHSFWMKNTLIPLDIIWINKDKKAIYINRNTPPCREDPCKIYAPQEPVQYVLEINAGVADEMGLKIGDELDFRDD